MSAIEGQPDPPRTWPEGPPLTRSGRTGGNQSALIFAALMIGHHLPISASCSTPSALGVCCAGGGISCPASVKRARTSPLLSAATTAPLSLSMISLGVPLGAHRPCQKEKYIAWKPSSSTVGTSGAANHLPCDKT